MSVARALQDIDLEKIAFIQYPTEYTDDLLSVVPAESGQVGRTSRCSSDVPVQFDPDATGNASYGTVRPGAPDGDPVPAGTDAAAAAADGIRRRDAAADADRADRRAAARRCHRADRRRGALRHRELRLTARATARRASGSGPSQARRGRLLETRFG